MTIRHPAERGGERRPFERLAEKASHFTSSRAFFGLCFLLVANFVAMHVVQLSTELELLAAGLMTSVTLLLLALLKNSELRAEHAIQRKLDAIAKALLAHHEGKEGGEAFDELRDAIRMEEEI
ncbi:hypothetical protein EKH77_29660 [Streptomyces luteoverticillatus]|uniref:Low affinity iron permease family protein n=1 Tax=Streptomyces luteoverticillatus TaxID=66425 RepID=A0A3Q9G0E5_STRLT|nr:hypothetical protein [Streptomyces luteoverticillatus]AZQ74812.1 hypothetical protein EKH77_29660 [Streptomyces luteoverticillatus]